MLSGLTRTSRITWNKFRLNSLSISWMIEDVDQNTTDSNPLSCNRFKKMERLADDLSADRQDQLRLLGDRDEFGRRL
jgi:hypothetical protein